VSSQPARARRPPGSRQAPSRRPGGGHRGPRARRARRSPPGRSARPSSVELLEVARRVRAFIDRPHCGQQPATALGALSLPRRRTEQFVSHCSRRRPPLALRTRGRRAHNNTPRPRADGPERLALLGAVQREPREQHHRNRVGHPPAQSRWSTRMRDQALALGAATPPPSPRSSIKHDTRLRPPVIGRRSKDRRAPIGRRHSAFCGLVDHDEGAFEGRHVRVCPCVGWLHGYR